MPTSAQRMVMWKMTHICHLLELVLMKKAWWVLAVVATRDEEIEEEVEEEGCGDDNEEDEEVFDVEEINPTSYIYMGTSVF
jgi:hypothetical protein